VSPAKALRQRFYKALWVALGIVWPIFSVLLGSMAILGVMTAMLEGWRWFEGIYFAFITGVTVGYGDLVPRRDLSRILAVATGFLGVMLTGLFAAVTVRALQPAVHETPAPEADQLRGP
jgi:hypothetical protein